MYHSKIGVVSILRQRDKGSDISDGYAAFVAMHIYIYS